MADKVFQASSGKAVRLDTINPDEIDILDIAHSLSRICRYNGHVDRDVWHYSVAQHSNIVADIVKPENRIYGFMHDFKEFAVGDRTTPLKSAIQENSWFDNYPANQCDGFVRLEDRFEIAILEHFNIPFPSPEAIADVKRADLLALMTEKRDICSSQQFRWAVDDLGIEPLKRRITAFSAREAFVDFMATAEELGLV